ncbi:MAG: ABC transporter permease [Prevotellaceae bacterium]|jgi:ABC-2 type transport system permease protein|nr:ABC transporter permease [Prevotellaceae bacterium]
MVKYLIEKEFKQFARNIFMPRLIVILPCLMMLILPWAADLEIKNINLSIVDNDHSTYSLRLINKIKSSGYFSLVNLSSTYSQAMEAVEKDEADVILEIPHDFEYQFVKDKTADVLISANTIDGTKGLIGSSYLSATVRLFAEELYDESGISPSSPTDVPVIDVATQNRFNPKMNYKIFMLPALMVMLLTLISGFMPALNIVSEKEIGTIEQINVTPVRKLTFIFSKLLTYWIISFIVLTICFIIVYFIYDLAPAGSLLTLYTASLIYTVTLTGLGLIISNYSSTVQQAMFVMFFFLIIFVLMSGMFTPVRSMPEWAQNITIFNPLKYFIEIMRSIYLKGSNFSEIAMQTGALCCFAIVSNIWAVFSYKKTKEN